MLTLFNNITKRHCQMFGEKSEQGFFCKKSGLESGSWRSFAEIIFYLHPPGF